MHKTDIPLRDCDDTDPRGTITILQNEINRLTAAKQIEQLRRQVAHKHKSLLAAFEDNKELRRSIEKSEKREETSAKLITSIIRARDTYQEDARHYRKECATLRKERDEAREMAMQNRNEISALRAHAERLAEAVHTVLEHDRNVGPYDGSYDWIRGNNPSQIILDEISQLNEEQFNSLHEEPRSQAEEIGGAL